MHPVRVAVAPRFRPNPLFSIFASTHFLVHRNFRVDVNSKSSTTFNSGDSQSTYQLE
ncbi:hypothetical protein SAMN05661044_05599 [Olivibacter domesticus]|uniref:Uncharacterized protein n=1 Tax=Olivibacter domesticus TaxID=407022 RepID=A0A1H7ZNH5_OLID1|nr:hypothetical protein SAMN05661044_05599 [Olivibacter domesticus]